MAWENAGWRAVCAGLNKLYKCLVEKKIPQSWRGNGLLHDIWVSCNSAQTVTAHFAESHELLSRIDHRKLTAATPES